MNCLIIGYGSIGSRHVSILKGLNHHVSIVSSQDIEGFPCFYNIEKAFDEKAYEYVVISNRTCDHYPTLLDLVKIRYNGHLLIEKPLFEETKILPEHIPQHTFVAYNLRFHPVVRKLIDLTKDRDIYSIQAYVGQYLPQWRPHMSYTKCYSAYRTQGGGVLRDLSHELDYITLITGGWYRVSAIGGRFSKLKIESDDLFCLLLETPRCPAVTIQMNYLDRKARRKLIVNCSDFSIRADLINNEIEVNAETIRYRNDRNTTYRDQHRAVLDGRTAELCTVQEGMAVLNLIEKAETAAAESIWTYR